MQSDIKIIPIFPTPVILTNINRNFTEDELQLLLFDIPVHKDDITLKMKNHRSKDLYLFENYNILQNIKSFCEHCLKQYLEEIEGANTDNVNLRITQSWLNKTKPQEYHHPHNHANSYLSAILYISCLPNDGIIFKDRSLRSYDNFNFSNKEPTRWNVGSMIQNVIEGDLIIFPSWIPHQVSVNKTKDKERISLSFNTFPIGEMGDYNEISQLKL